MKKNTCRLCGADSLNNILELKNVPRDVQSLNKIQITEIGWTLNLEVLCCSKCNLVQINPVLSDDYYEDYLMGTTHSDQMLQYQLKQASDFIAKYNLVGKHVKEVGCGDGTFLKFLQSAGAMVSGIEPSKPFREKALQKGLKVYAADVRIGLLISFIMAGINLMLDLYMEWYYVYSLVITLSFISLLALSLYQTSKSQTASNLL